MAKALLGHVGGPDPRMVSEMRRLQQRVHDLENELARLQEENDVLVATVGNDLLIPVREPALAAEPWGEASRRVRDAVRRPSSVSGR